jgi:hypothetical protein
LVEWRWLTWPNPINWYGSTGFDTLLGLPPSSPSYLTLPPDDTPESAELGWLPPAWLIGEWDEKNEVELGVTGTDGDVVEATEDRMEREAVWLIGLPINEWGEEMARERAAWRRLSLRGTEGMPLGPVRLMASWGWGLSEEEVVEDEEEKKGGSTVERGRPNSKGEEGRVEKEGTEGWREGEVWGVVRRLGLLLVDTLLVVLAVDPPLLKCWGWLVDGLRAGVDWNWSWVEWSVSVTRALHSTARGDGIDDEVVDDGGVDVFICIVIIDCASVEWGVDWPDDDEPLNAKWGWDDLDGTRDGTEPS